MKHVLENKLNSFLEKKKIQNILVITGQKSFNFCHVSFRSDC